MVGLIPSCIVNIIMEHDHMHSSSLWDLSFGIEPNGPHAFRQLVGDSIKRIFLISP